MKQGFQLRMGGKGTGCWRSGKNERVVEKFLTEQGRKLCREI